MGLFNFNKTEATPVVVNKNKEKNLASFGNVNDINLSIHTDLPVVKALPNREWVTYGVDNKYPEFLKQLFNTSPTHQAIIKTKALMTGGQGYTIQDSHLNEQDKIKVRQLLGQIDRQLIDIALDQQIYGAVALELQYDIWMKNIIKVNRIDPSKLRAGKMEETNEIEEWFYSDQWAEKQQKDIKEIYSFQEADNENARQLLYVPMQLVSNDYYGEPSYTAGIDWVTLESQTGVYYRALIENGFSPSLQVTFYTGNATAEEKSTIAQAFKRMYAGAKNAGKVLFTFAKDKESAPSIEPIATQNVDKQFTVIADQIVTKILTSGRVTTPEMFGIAIPGKLGNADFATQVNAFTKFVIEPDQRKLEQAINRIFNANGYNIDFKLNAFKLEQ